MDNDVRRTTTADCGLRAADSAASRRVQDAGRRTQDAGLPAYRHGRTRGIVPSDSATLEDPTRRFDAVSFDFYGTLARHRDGRGRGSRIMEYFAAQGWQSEPWVHGVLYDLFAEVGPAYDPGRSQDEHREFCERVALGLFARLSVRATPNDAAAHALELWRLVGPESLEIFPDAPDALAQLRANDLQLVVVSNWTCGLGAFCRALGIGAHFAHVVASQEAGAAKPDPRIFEEACRRLDLPPDRVLHVGDSLADDVEGARQAGLHPLYLRRERWSGAWGATTGDWQPETISTLAELPGYVVASR